MTRRNSPVRIVTALSFLCVVPALPGAANAQADSAARSWNEPVPPFRIIGNLYYIGAADITSYLIVTSDGLIVIDGGLVETAPQILANIRTLGFDPQDIRILLNSHAHYDHAGGLAQLKRLTGAQLVAGLGDSALLAAGGHGDFAFGDRFPFPPVTVDRTVTDGDTVRLGDTYLVAVATPGHTKGCTTWTMPVTQDGHGYQAVFICSLTIGEYALRGNPAYPTIAADFRASIARLRLVRCDVFLAPHGSIFDLQSKMARRAGAGTSPFIDPDGCRRYIDGAARDLDEKLQSAP